MANKRKITTAIVAGVTAVALMLGGTFAWTSISQQAKNETAGIVNVGGRLHDDFNGTNKDVYVENFTDPLDGGQPIYARVRLDEYMEVGSEAGKTDENGYVDGRNATPVVANTDIDDVTTWKPHVPSTSCAACATTGTCAIHDHWTWTMGGEGDNGGKTTFMPTFNKDKDSLAADINGTYAGINADDKIYYDDYVVYTTDNTTGGVGVAEADKETYDGNIYSVIGTEIYDDDTDTDENDHASGAGVRTEENVTHTAKQTATAEVMTMADWIAAGSNPGNYWVYDTDGWAYWANPIMPGEATGLLLDGIEMEKNPGEKCYYAINVVGQFATVNDWTYFDDGAPSEAAKELLTAASQNVATVTVTNVDGKTSVEPDNTVKFSATISTPSDAAALAADDFVWTVLDKEHNVSATSSIAVDENGIATLTVGASERSRELIIVAKATAPDYLGAVGLSAVAVILPPEVETTDNMDAPVWGLLTDDGSGNGTYAMTYVRSYDAIVVNEFMYKGETIVGLCQFKETYSARQSWSQNLIADKYDKITSVSFENPVAPRDMSDWFYRFTALKSVDFTNLDGSKITSMVRMFDDASAIESIDMTPITLSSSNEVYIGDMFSGCSSLKEVKMPKNLKADTHSYARTFYGCSNLVTIENLETWDVSMMGRFDFFFADCPNLKNINLTGWTFSTTTKCESMFSGCTALTEIPGAEAWSVENVSDMNRMFSRCENLVLDCSSWNVATGTTHASFNNNAPGVTPPTWP